MSWQEHELDDSIYMPDGVEPTLALEVTVLPFDPSRPRKHDGHEYLLSIEQVRDVVEGLEQQLGRSVRPMERLRAVLHYAKHDAFIDPESVIE